MATRLSDIRAARRAPPRPAPPQPPSSGRIGRVLSHPLTAIVVSSFVGSLVVPTIVQHIDEQKRLRDRQHEVASKIIANSIDDTSGLSELDTILRRTYLSNPERGAPSARSRRQQAVDEAGATFERTYLTFNGRCWYWPWQVFEEAKMEGILRHADTIRQFDEAVQEYIQVLSQATRSEKELKARLVTGAEVADLKTDSNPGLQRLQAAMFGHARDMARIVLSPQPCALRVGSVCILEQSPGRSRQAPSVNPDLPGIQQGAGAAR